MPLVLVDRHSDALNAANRPEWDVIKDEAVAWDNPATVAYQKRRRRTTALQAGVCVVVIFALARLSSFAPGLSGFLVFVNAVVFVSTIGFLFAFSRLSIRERTLRTADWFPVEVTGHPVRIYGMTIGTVLRVRTNGGGELFRLATSRAGAELLDASRQPQSLLRAGEKNHGFVLARPSGAPVVLARRIGPRWLQDAVWISSSEKENA